MSQNLQLLLFLFLGIILHIINEVRKSHKQEDTSIQPPKAPAKIYTKTTPIKSQEAEPSVWEKEEDSLLPKSSSSRAKKILNRARLRQSILTSEILGRKY
ncbi:MAG TPA: hypothetical protein VGZ69_07740 [Candidatus Rhabdochlamydia sp.]|jgi:hypothetical protein|nr:hypothetical protein [Candidatus Rhabdochlamydia sp.]